MPSTFLINEIIYIPRRGLVAIGNILKGAIQAGNIAKVEIDGQNYSFEISGVEIVDRMNSNESLVALVFKCDSFIKPEDINLNSQVIEII